VLSGIGFPELLIVLVIALLVLGPKKLPEVGRSLGRGMREFKDSVSGITSDKDDDEDDVRSLNGSSSAAGTTTRTSDPTSSEHPTS